LLGSAAPRRWPFLPRQTTFTIHSSRLRLNARASALRSVICHSYGDQPAPAVDPKEALVGLGSNGQVCPTPAIHIPASGPSVSQRPASHSRPTHAEATGG